MSAVTNQPLPFGRLEREKHIQMIFRAFNNPCGPLCECLTHSSGQKLCHTTLNREREGQQSEIQPPLKKLEEEEQEEGPVLGDAAGLHFVSALKTVSQIQITARPEVQGLQSVSRRIYSANAAGHSCVWLWRCPGPARACSLQGFDRQGRQVFHFERVRVDGCCLMELRAYTPQKSLIGSVHQRWSMFTPLLEVGDSDGSSAIRIQGSCCPSRCFSNQQLQIFSNIREPTGGIWKKHNMDHEFFGLEVALGLESHTKLLLLAATFLLSHVLWDELIGANGLSFTHQPTPVGH